MNLITPQPAGRTSGKCALLLLLANGGPGESQGDFIAIVARKQSAEVC